MKLLLTLIGILRNQDALLKGQHRIMSQISDFATTVEGNFASIKTGITNLDTQIQTLLTNAQNQGGQLSDADLALLKQVADDSATLATAANAPVTIPAAPAPPAQ